jgi:predicted GNAT family acetyltransferase
MSWVTTTDSADLWKGGEAGPGAFVRSRPTEHTVLLTVTESIRRQGADVFGDRPPEFGWWTGADGRISAAFVRTPPHAVLLSDLPAPAVTPLARLFADRDPALSGANGPADAVHAFGAAWERETGGRAVLREAQRLYRLGTLAAPAPVPGQRGRLASAADRDLLADWVGAFAREVGGPPPRHPGRYADHRIAYGGLALWEDAGRPVSLAGRTPVLHGMARVAPVYTPVPLRRRGYAAAATALVCQTALAAGAREVLLFTDLANPTSNALYQRLGFRPVRDHRAVDFTGGSGM